MFDYQVPLFDKITFTIWGVMILLFVISMLRLTFHIGKSKISKPQKILSHDKKINSVV
jgi:hypothetical protein